VSAAVSVPPSSSRRSGYLAELWRRREFAWYMAIGDIRSRHANTSLGLVWWVLSPLLLGLVYLLVFGVILNTRRGDPNYIGFLLSGLFAFYYTSQSLTAGSTSLLSNARLVSTTWFPRLILPIAAIIEGAIGFVFSMLPFFLIAGFVNGDWPGWHTFLLIPALLFHTMFNLGLACLFGLLAIPFRDVSNLLPYLNRVWLYTSPVIFPIDERVKDASDTLYFILSLNPLASILGFYRAALLGRELTAGMVIGSVAWGIGLMVVGVTLFIRNEPRLARYL
jgi:teichoic acid transport system permease protein